MPRGIRRCSSARGASSNSQKSISGCPAPLHSAVAWVALLHSRAALFARRDGSDACARTPPPGGPTRQPVSLREIKDNAPSASIRSAFCHFSILARRPDATTPDPELAVCSPARMLSPQCPPAPAAPIENRTKRRNADAMELFALRLFRKLINFQQEFYGTLAKTHFLRSLGIRGSDIKGDPARSGFFQLFQPFIRRARRSEPRQRGSEGFRGGISTGGTVFKTCPPRNADRSRKGTRRADGRRSQGAQGAERAERKEGAHEKKACGAASRRAEGGRRLTRQARRPRVTARL